MSGTVSPTAAYVDVTGIHAPGFAVIQRYLISSYQSIYGADVLLTADNQDGQLVGIFAAALADTNAACVAVYNSFSPTTAQGVGLSSNVKINGMRRALPTNSQVNLLIVGEAGRTILDGAASDLASNLWMLPPAVTIPPEGEIEVSALAANSGDIQALPNTITRIATPTRGWQTVNNPLAAVPGDPVETDAALRRRQSQSTSLPALSVLDGVTGAVLMLPGVLDVKTYENDTDVTDPVTSLPPHSICLVVRGGDTQLICDTILLKKTPGCYTYGNTRRPTPDVYGIAHDIGFIIPTQIIIRVQIALTAKLGFLTEIGDAITASVANFITDLTSGDDVIYSKLWSPANLMPDTSGLSIPPNAGNTYDITSIQIAKGTAPLTTNNIVIALGEEAACTTFDVTLIIT